MRHDSTFYGGLLLLLGALCGCSKPAGLPGEVAQRVTQADRIVATNKHVPFPLTITGEEVGRVGKAVASARHDRHNYAGIWDWDVQFYQGTNFLTVIHLMDQTFWTEDTQYADDTGVLKAFYRRLIEDADKLQRATERH